MKSPWFNVGFAFGASAALGWSILRVEGNTFILGKPHTRGCALVQPVSDEKLLVKSFDSYPEFVVEHGDKMGVSNIYEVECAPRWAWNVVRHLATESKTLNGFGVLV